MLPWNARETADIVYDDVEGNLTRWLIDGGHLAEHEWQRARPQYFLEVKTTTGPCDWPFYMSKKQYERVSALYPPICVGLLKLMAGHFRCKTSTTPRAAKGYMLCCESLGLRATGSACRFI